MAWEKLGTTSVGGTAITNTSWKELGRTTLGSAGDSINVASFAAKDNLMILTHAIQDGVIIPSYQFNGDTGNNYAIRYNLNYGSDGTAGSQGKIQWSNAGSAHDNFGVGQVANVAAQEKLVIQSAMKSATGAGNAPDSEENIGKWANTSNQITTVNVMNTQSGDFATGSEVVVLGFDNDEADSGTNFWQELVYKDLDSSNLTTGTFTAKKYLMVKLGVYTGGTTDHRLRFNGDSGSNYSNIRSDGGGSGSDSTSQSSIPYDRANKDNLSTIFIINKSDKEKLALNETISGAGTGASTAPGRREMCYKWANTSAQITEISLLKNSGTDLISPSFIQVFGAD